MAERVTSPSRDVERGKRPAIQALRLRILPIAFKGVLAYMTIRAIATMSAAPLISLLAAG
ncbi:hypothetical protein TM49_17200 [Martelella endophytica]|uniref:Uncharacterized protein n=1 Tax=Martelella endophytica TaxID=1486262 RepID=A0A0D5LTD8_MAREN|nr:hypothetical protein TM49_17200 [Martelella endophytica]